MDVALLVLCVRAKSCWIMYICSPEEFMNSQILSLVSNNFCLQRSFSSLKDMYGSEITTLDINCLRHHFKLDFILGGWLTCMHIPIISYSIFGPD